MSSGMNIEEAKKIADKMSYREAIMNCLCARCVPYRKATTIKMKRLLESIEAPYVDLDTPMHFTQEQKAWIKKYLSINGERQRADGAREFADKLIDKCKENYENKDLALECKKCMIWRREEILEALAEWQKGKENESNNIQSATVNEQDDYSCMR